MTDKELLELSAKAAGISVRWHDSGYYGPTMEIMDDESGGPPWNEASFRFTLQGRKGYDTLRALIAYERFEKGE
jgi:hypothetical protein